MRVTALFILEPWHVQCSRPSLERGSLRVGIRLRGRAGDVPPMDWRRSMEWIVGEVSVAKEDRGFASMDRAKQREIASKGGKAAHQKGTAHEWTSEEAREAGRKGGMASHQRRRQQLDSQG